MKEFQINENEIIKYKTGLTEPEYITIIQVAVDAYNNGIEGDKDNLAVVPYNPIKAQQAFYRALFQICVENYDIDKFDTYFAAGLVDQLMSDVINAYRAWQTVQNIIDDSTKTSVALNNFLTGVLDMLDAKLPEGTDITKVLKKFPKDLSKALADYTSVMAPTKVEFDEKEANGDYKDIENK